MGALDLFLTTARLALLLAGLLLPGAALLRSLRLPWTLGASVVGSSVILYSAVLFLTLVHLPISLLTLTAFLAISSFICVLLARRPLPKNAPALPPPEDTAPFDFLTKLGRWTPLYAAVLTVLLWRLATQPLSGADVHFRWSWLAEQIIRLGHLDFYPPRTPADYSTYGWPESIPPGIASLHAWAFACAGTMRALWTSPGILLQLLALHEFIWRIAFSWGGEPAARRALIFVAATPFLSWSTIIGQETGLTALAVCALLFGLLRWHKTRATPWLAFAALASVAGASAREYGPAFPVLGLGVLALMRAPRPALLRFAVIALPLAAVWPLRTWLLTGNPFFSLKVAGLFPTNPVFAAWSAHFHTEAARSVFALDAWRQATRYLVLFAPGAIFGGLALVLHARRGLREARWCLLCAALVTALWLASVPLTAGGFFYSMRVLSPAFALAAAFGGYALLAASTPARRVLDATLVLGLLATLPHSLTLPVNAYRHPIRTWPDIAREYEIEGTGNEAELLRALRALPRHDRVLSDFPSLHHAFVGLPITTVPLWSPEVAWLFDPKLPTAEITRRWRDSKLRYVITSPDPAFRTFLTQRAQWRAPTFALVPVWQSQAYLILEVIPEPPAAH
jgi:hypothetical protein